MQVAFDAGPLLDARTGVGRYAAELAEALATLGVGVEKYAVALGGSGDPSIKRWRIPAKVMQSVWRRFDRPAIKRLTGRTDVVHGTNFVLPALGGIPGVVTVHDLSFYRDDAFPGGERLRDLVPWSVSRSGRVIVPTAAVAEEVADAYGVALERLVVTHEGVAPHFFGATPLPDPTLASLGIKAPFALALGTIEPRKNLAGLLAAWSAAALEDWTLVLAGPEGWGPKLPEVGGVQPIGWVADETLPGLLAAAEIFCYPSLYEGFGLPPLEAMAAGTPVLAGRYPCAEEVLGDAALVVDPRNVEEMAAALQSLVADGEARQRLAAAGRARAARYTWIGTALATLRAYEEVVAA